jgi:hypothetical protein
LKHLRRLYLRGNAISGTVPEAWAALQLAKLDLKVRAPPTQARWAPQLQLQLPRVVVERAAVVGWQKNRLEADSETGLPWGKALAGVPRAESVPD